MFDNRDAFEGSGVIASALGLAFLQQTKGVFTEITGNSGEDKIKIDEIHMSIVFGMLIKCCKIETHFLFETAKLNLKVQ